MDFDFPPLPAAQADLVRLSEMFPSTDRAVISMVLDATQGRMEAAMEALLTMDCTKTPDVPVQTPPDVGFAQVAATILQSPSRMERKQSPQIPESQLQTLRVNDDLEVGSTVMASQAAGVQHISLSPFDTTILQIPAPVVNEDPAIIARSYSPRPILHEDIEPRLDTIAVPPAINKSRSPSPAATQYSASLMRKDPYRITGSYGHQTPGKTFQSPASKVRKDPSQMSGSLFHRRRINNDLDQGSNVMVVMRGLPGSGKSTLARRLVSSASCCSAVFSSDDFFLSYRGVYMFNPNKVGEAHAWNQAKVSRAVSDGVRLIVVDNTNTQAWEMKPYIVLAVNNGYKVHIMEPDTPWKFNPRVLAHKNSHGVPLFKIRQMFERYQRHLNLDTLLDQWNLVAKPEINKEPFLPPVNCQNDDEEEIFQSDPEDFDDEENHNNFGHEEDEELTGTSSKLNPDVAEFVPQTSREASPITITEQFEQLELDEEHNKDVIVENETEINNDDEDNECIGLGVGHVLRRLRQEAEQDDARSPSHGTDGNEPDIAQLLSIFPHLSLGQLETLYMVHKGSTTNVVTALLDEAEELERNTLDLIPKPIPDSEASIETTYENAASPIREADSPTVKMKLDPIFSTMLKEQFGSPIDESLLRFFNPEELLEVDLPQSLAFAVFDCWRKSLEVKLTSKSLLQNETEDKVWLETSPNSISLAVDSAPPKTVLAPNAVEYYEGRMLAQAMTASLKPKPGKPKPQVVLAGTRPPGYDRKEHVQERLEGFIQQRKELYSKARAGNKMQGVSGYYTAEARELTNLIRTKQKESQMEMFLEANRDISSNKLDLHFLQIGDAVKNLSLFVAEKQSKLIKGQAEFVEIVTGKGTRSDNGKSRLKPAVQGWLDQKKLPYTEVNPGCLKVQITSSSS